MGEEGEVPVGATHLRTQWLCKEQSSRPAPARLAPAMDDTHCSQVTTAASSPPAAAVNDVGEGHGHPGHNKRMLPPWMVRCADGGCARVWSRQPIAQLSIHLPASPLAFGCVASTRSERDTYMPLSFLHTLTLSCTGHSSLTTPSH